MLVPTSEDISIIIDKLKELKNLKEKFKAKKFLTPIQQGVFNAQNKPLWLYIWKMPDEVQRENFTNCNIPLQYPQSKYGRLVVVDDKELKLYSENEKGEAKHKGIRVDLDEELLVLVLKQKLKKKRQQYWIENIQTLIDEINKLLVPFWDYLNTNGSWGTDKQSRIETAIQAQDSTDLNEVIHELDKVHYKVEKELNQKVVLQQCGIEHKSKLDGVPSGELIKILNDLVSEFKGQCFWTRISCQKITLPKGTDADKLISRIISCPIYQKEKYTTGEDDVYFVFYSLEDDSGLLTLFKVASRPTIGKAVNQLLLDKYDVSSIPDSVMFIINYPKLAAEDKTPFSVKEWSVVHWYEFLFKLGDERASLICPKKYDTRITDVKECWHLGSDVFDASMKALDYLLEKVKLLEQKEQSEPDKNKKRKVKTKKSEQRFKPWKNPGDARLVIDKQRVKFHHNDKTEDLRFKNEGQSHKMLLFLTSGSMTPNEMKENISPNTQVTAAKIAEYTNECLNKKIRSVGFTCLPDYDVEFIKRDGFGHYIPAITIQSKEAFESWQKDREWQ